MEVKNETQTTEIKQDEKLLSLDELKKVQGGGASDYGRDVAYLQESIFKT